MPKVTEQRRSAPGTTVEATAANADSGMHFHHLFAPRVAFVGSGDVCAPTAARKMRRATGPRSGSVGLRACIPAGDAGGRSDCETLSVRSSPAQVFQTPSWVSVRVGKPSMCFGIAGPRESSASASHRQKISVGTSAPSREQGSIVRGAAQPPYDRGPEVEPNRWRPSNGSGNSGRR